MAIFPKIQSPCPYKSQLAAVMDGDMCRMCKRQVFDLSDMRDEERVAFLAGCSGEVCVSYRFPLRKVIAAAAMATAAMPAAAQDVAAQGAADMDVGMEIIVGGIRHPDKVEYVSDAASDAADQGAAKGSDDPAPDLPVVYEDDASDALVTAPVK